MYTFDRIRLINYAKDCLLNDLTLNKDIKLGRKLYCKNSEKLTFRITLPPEHLEFNYMNYEDMVNDNINMGTIQLYYDCKRLSIRNNSYIYIDDFEVNIEIQDNEYIQLIFSVDVYYTKNKTTSIKEQINKLKEIQNAN